MRHALTAAVFVLLVSSWARADDVAVVAASLPNEAAECRYVLDLCRDLESYQRTIGSLGSREPDPDVNERIVGQQMAELRRLEDRARAAARVIRAKHDHEPVCFRDCKGMTLSYP